ncbi:MAG TPA: GH3 auxin-responsive promoter family protein, partial [Saprospiraceae bacterium]|nr:GH3 auxin-responsive promoter family protein [Saprospiraceae bacterium]
MIQNIPAVGRPFFTPDIETALMSEWEAKIDRIAQITSREKDVVMIGGVPTWTVVLFRRILEITGKSNILEVWPNFETYTHGGVGFEPYRKQFAEFLPSDQVSYMEVYNASEGFFAIQNDLDEDGMLLLLNNGMYFEFIPAEEWHKEEPLAIPLSEVEIGKNYALVVSTNSGLWRYSPGDTVSFTSTRPYKIKITGRTEQFVNAFGEELMISNTDKALAITCRQLNAAVADYTVAPIYFSKSGKGGHEWLVEFDRLPKDLEKFAKVLDKNIQQINSDYEAKRYKSMALKQLKLQPVPKGTFHRWLKSKGKYGGQHKVPRLANDRKYLDDILNFLEKDYTLE